MNTRQVIDKNMEFIKENLKDHTAFWISKQLKIGKSAMYRFLKANNMKAMDMKLSLSVQWTGQMISYVKKNYPVKFSKDMAAELNISLRTLNRKAKELGLTKEEGFLEKNREEITKRAVEAHPKPSQEIIERNLINAGKPHRFKKNNKQAKTKTNPWITRRKNEEAIKKALKNPY